MIVMVGEVSLCVLDDDLPVFIGRRGNGNPGLSGGVEIFSGV